MTPGRRWPTSRTCACLRGHGLTNAAGLIHPRAGPDGSDTDMPTTIVMDRQSTVRWLCSREAIARLSPDEVLQAVDLYLPTK